MAFRLARAFTVRAAHKAQFRARFLTFSCPSQAAPCVHLGARRGVSTLILGEFEGSAVSNATRAAVTAAKKLGGPVHVVLAGEGAAAAAPSAASVVGVDKVVFSEDASLKGGVAEGISALLQGLHAANSASRWRRAGWWW